MDNAERIPLSKQPPNLGPESRGKGAAEEGIGGPAQNEGAAIEGEGVRSKELRVRRHAVERFSQSGHRMAKKKRQNES